MVSTPALRATPLRRIRQRRVTGTAQRSSDFRPMSRCRPGGVALLSGGDNGERAPQLVTFGSFARCKGGDVGGNGRRGVAQFVVRAPGSTSGGASVSPCRSSRRGSGCGRGYCPGSIRESLALAAHAARRSGLSPLAVQDDCQSGARPPPTASDLGAAAILVGDTAGSGGRGGTDDGRSGPRASHRITQLAGACRRLSAVL